MGISVIPAPSAASKTMFRTTLTSGTSYTVPAGVTYLNVTLNGGGGGGASSGSSERVASSNGKPGQRISSTLSVTAGSSIDYAIGAGGTGGSGSAFAAGGAGGSTTFTGATTASGGEGTRLAFNNSSPGTSVAGFNNGGQSGGNYSGSASSGGAGGAGWIDIEYWV
jgi:hypothetical protein